MVYKLYIKQKFEYMQCFIGWLLRNSALKHDYFINKKHIPLINSLIAHSRYVLNFNLQNQTVTLELNKPLQMWLSKSKLELYCYTSTLKVKQHLLKFKSEHQNVHIV